MISVTCKIPWKVYWEQEIDLQYPKVDANTRPLCYATGCKHKGFRRHYRNFLPPINFLVYWFYFLGIRQKSLEKSKGAFLRSELCWIFVHKADINLKNTNSPTAIKMNS